MINVLTIENTTTQYIEDTYVNSVAVNGKKLNNSNITVLEKKIIFSQVFASNAVQRSFKTFIQKALSSSDL